MSTGKSFLRILQGQTLVAGKIHAGAGQEQWKLSLLASNFQWKCIVYYSWVTCNLTWRYSLEKIILFGLQRNPLLSECQGNSECLACEAEIYFYIYWVKKKLEYNKQDFLKKSNTVGFDLKRAIAGICHVSL